MDDDDRPATTNISNRKLKELPVPPTRRLYQAYCVTEAASSRPSSPDNVNSKYLEKSSKNLCSASSQPTLHPTQNPLPPPPQQDNSANDSQDGIQNQNEKYVHHRQATQKFTSDKHHLTPAVTARGNYHLINQQTSLYHQTPSHPRVQQSGQMKPAADQLLSYGSSRQCTQPITTRRPLPPVPTDERSQPALKINLRVESFGQNLLTSGFWTVSESDLTRPMARDGNANGEAVKIDSVPPSGSTKVDAYEAVNHRCLTLQNPRDGKPQGKRPQLPSRGLHSDPDIQEESRRGTFPMKEGPQLSSVELRKTQFSPPYTPDANSVERAIESNDVRSRYLFGRRPSTKFDLSIPSPQQRKPPFSSVRTRSSSSYVTAFSRSAPSLHSSHYPSQSGPRPPPWGSYDDLESLRKCRGEAREREECRIFCTNENAALHGRETRVAPVGYQKTKGAKSDVDAFRKQILSVYPDWEREGSEGDRRRGRMCCIVM